MDFLQVTLSLLAGFGNTCLIFIITLALSLPIGLLVAFGSMSRFKPLRAVVRVFVWVIRGTPLMLQVLFIYYGPALLFHLPIMPRLIAVLVAFVINYACYFSEIYRGGIESIPRGQYEAGQVLGMTKGQIFFRIVLIQVVKRITPPMSNEVISLVKDTSLARVIVVTELVKSAENFLVKGLVWPLFYTAAFYLVFVGILTLLFRFLEKNLAYIKV